MLIWRLELIYYQLKTLLNPYFTKEMHLFACKSVNICTFKNIITQGISFVILKPWSVNASFMAFTCVPHGGVANSKCWVRGRAYHVRLVDARQVVAISY